MTDTEDAANAERNARIQNCRHVPYRLEQGGIRCRNCEAVFIVMLLPRRAPVPVYDFDDED